MEKQDNISKQDLEEIYMQDKKKNYINYLAFLIASNINSWYKLYHNNDDISYEVVAGEAEDPFVLSEKDQELLHSKISKTLKNKYHLEIIDYDKLKIKEISKNKCISNLGKVLSQMYLFFHKL